MSSKRTFFYKDPRPGCNWIARCTLCMWITHNHESRSAARNAAMVHEETPTHLANAYRRLG